MQWACPPLLLPITVQRVSDLWQGAGLQVDGVGEGGEAFLTLPLPTGPDSLWVLGSVAWSLSILTLCLGLLNCLGTLGIHHVPLAKSLVF